MTAAAAGTPAMRVIGTAGHVDHGKSTLIRALTGIDPDRLREEKERGMTIDLGFAWLRLPNGAEVSMVDVPGHERFIHNMLAGIGGIDIALLVVAADEGIMPQTREHLAILDLLGIQQGVVALTKHDLVEQDWLELISADVEEAIAATSLAGAPVIPCSATTGHGLDELKAILQELVARGRSRPTSGLPRLPIDRAFTVAGFGTVVTGTLLDGELRLGQELAVQPGGRRTRVRGLQSHKHKVDTVPAGTRVAVNLVGVAVEDLQRGQVLAPPGALNATRALDARLRVLKDSPPLTHNLEVTFHTGAAESIGRVSVLDGQAIEPGAEGWVQIRPRDELAVAKGDLFVVRLPSPSLTIGGGSIVEPHARRHRRRQPEVLDRLAVLAEGSTEEVLLQQLALEQPRDVDTLAKRAGIAAADARAALAGMLGTRVLALNGDGGVPRLDGRTFVITLPGWQALVQRVIGLLEPFHRAYPLRRGLPREELRARLGVEPRLFVRVLGQLLAEGVLAEDGPFVRLASCQVSLSPVQERQAQSIRDLLREAGVAPPERAEWEHVLGTDPELTDALVARGDLVEVTPELVYEAGALASVVERVRQALAQRGPLTVSEIRELLDSSRKYVVPLLEYTDGRKVTRRAGDKRLLY